MCGSCKWCVSVCVYHGGSVWWVVCVCAYVNVFDSNGKRVSTQTVTSGVRSPSTSVAHLLQKHEGCQAFLGGGVTYHFKVAVVLL